MTGVAEFMHLNIIHAVTFLKYNASDIGSSLSCFNVGVICSRPLSVSLLQKERGNLESPYIIHLYRFHR